MTNGTMNKGSSVTYLILMTLLALDESQRIFNCGGNPGRTFDDTTDGNFSQSLFLREEPDTAFRRFPVLFNLFWKPFPKIHAGNLYIDETAILPGVNFMVRRNGENPADPERFMVKAKSRSDLHTRSA